MSKECQDTRSVWEGVLTLFPEENKLFDNRKVWYNI